MLIGLSSLNLPSRKCVESFHGMERRQREAFHRKLTAGTEASKPEGGAADRIKAFHLHVPVLQLEQAVENGVHESVGNRGTVCLVALH